MGLKLEEDFKITPELTNPTERKESSTPCLCPIEGGRATTERGSTTVGFVTLSGECLCPSLSSLGETEETATQMPWTTNRGRHRRGEQKEAQLSVDKWDQKIIKNLPFL